MIGAAVHVAQGVAWQTPAWVVAVALLSILATGAISVITSLSVRLTRAERDANKARFDAIGADIGDIKTSQERMERNIHGWIGKIEKRVDRHERRIATLEAREGKAA